MSQDTPSHACRPSSPCSCSPRRPAAPGAWKYRVTAAPALCFVFKGSPHCFLFPPESADVCVLWVGVRVGVAGVEQVGGGGGDCKGRRWGGQRTEDTLGERLTVVMPHDVDIVAGVAVHTRAHLGPRHIVRHPTGKMGKLSGWWRMKTYD